MTEAASAAPSAETSKTSGASKTSSTGTSSTGTSSRERGVLLPPRGLSIPRTLVAVAGAATALVAIVVGHGDLGAFGWIEVGLLGAATLAMLLDRVDAHVFVRSVLWGVMAYGAIHTMDSFHPWAEPSAQVRAASTLLGPAVSLLALGRAGLDGEHGAFFPIVMRRSLLTMMVVGLCVAHVLAVFTLAWDPHWTLMLAAGTTPLLLTAGVAGLSRTRTWGLLAYLSAIVSAVVVVVLALNPPEAWTVMPSEIITPLFAFASLWGLGGALALLVGVPVLAAIVVKPKPRPAGRPWGTYAHALMVLGFVGSVAYLVA